MLDRNASPLRLEIRRFSPAFASLLLFSFVISLISLTPTLFMLQMYERVMQSRSETTLIFLVVIVAWMILLWTALESTRVRLLQGLATTLSDRISGKVFNTLNRKPDKFNSTTRNAVLGDLNIIREFVGGGLILQLLDLCFAPLFIFVAFLFHPLLGAALLAILCLVVTLTLAHQALVRNSIQRAQLNGAQAGDLGRSIMANSDLVRVMGMLPALRSRWLRKQRDMLGWQAAAADRARVVGDILRFVRHAQLSVIMTVGMLLYLDQQVGGGIIFAASVLSSRAIQPIDGVASGWRAFWTVRMSARRVDAVLREAIEIEGLRFALPRPAGDLVVSRVSVAAPLRDEIILNDVSLHARAGRILGVVGASGAGKSSLARILVGIWQPRRGTVTLDGHDLSHWDQDELGRHIGYVPQDVDFLAGTVGENIGRLQEGAALDHAAVLDAVKLAGMQDVIKALPDGLNTRLGPDGHVLSGGQRQRLALARAVYGDPSLLVLDEPNSNLDAIGEEGLSQTMTRMRDQGCVVIIVTHRMNMLSHCDDVLVMHAGSVSAFGERDHIIARLNSQPRQKLSIVRNDPSTS